MKLTFSKILLASALIGICVGPARAVSRATGLGVRMNFWNITNQPTSIRISATGQNITTNISGTGGSIYFFSRVHDNWFLEFNLGAIAAVQGGITNFTEIDEEVSTIIPILFGLRYDLFSIHLPGLIRPYLTAGAGPYAQTSVSFNGDGANSTQFESHLNYGAYLGGGTNMMLCSWAALNFDLKYHFVELQRDQNAGGLELSAGFCFMWGRKREIFDIKEVKVIVQDIYPVFYPFYNTYPLALVSVKNVAGYPIEINVHSFIKDFSARPLETGFMRLERNETKDIPIKALLSPRVKNVARRETAILDLEIEARAGATIRREFSTQIIVHHRNAWDGDMEKLIFFVTPEEPEILEFTRQIAAQISVPPHAARFAFELAKAIFNQLTAMNLRYQRDPNIPFYQDDRVQFATETLQLLTGDCDDLTVLLASLLESAGIHTAFVEVRDPDKAIAHLYLLFDSGLPPNLGNQISTNDKRFVIRANPAGQPTLWIPLETTLVNQNFETAWIRAAGNYLQEGTLRGGLTDGWVKIIDVK